MTAPTIAAQAMNDSDDDDPHPLRYGDVQIDISIRSAAWDRTGLCHSLIEKTVPAVFGAIGIKSDIPGEISFSFVDDDEIQQLNAEYRDKNKPTNVLSFPGCDPDMLNDYTALAKRGGPPVMFGDIIITYGVVAEEAMAQNKKFVHHLHHLLVHGLLHLLGYDHIEEDEAEEMEALEKRILQSFGISDPYAVVEAAV
ncbi:endoribonuclease YbeY [Kordiimonas sediminis]|uniref:Endoribonuclease YbeY n=1 Tax=Kordiimonas sediminis TaxID=1735581 RepID=A0A919E5Z2_9PROT|nr:rRNA maturation RNase YbeY [Kordiimonas sediminis]GHF16279.1 endoribonuclease YbeY [Kordiimonas sediminis]